MLMVAEGGVAASDEGDVSDGEDLPPVQGAPRSVASSNASWFIPPEARRPTPSASPFGIGAGLAADSAAQPLDTPRPSCVPDIGDLARGTPVFYKLDECQPMPLVMAPIAASMTTTASHSMTWIPRQWLLKWKG